MLGFDHLAESVVFRFEQSSGLIRGVRSLPLNLSTPMFRLPRRFGGCGESFGQLAPLSGG
jgi:hypothetical protein